MVCQSTPHPQQNSRIFYLLENFTILVVAKTGGWIVYHDVYNHLALAICLYCYIKSLSTGYVGI